MEKRILGKTGIKLSALGFGGFHLVEIPFKEADYLLNKYIDSGGNYIETAAVYGGGNSEIKIGKSLSSKRDKYFLATKCSFRDIAGAEKQINNSLKNLKTDYVDFLFVHHLQDPEELKQLTAENGALSLFRKMKELGRARFIAVSAHGRPDGLLPAIKTGVFDVIMTGFNFFDRFNFPQIEDKLLPEALSSGIGVIAMKSFADGYLYKSPEQALRYTLSLPVSTVVLGMNRPAHLDFNLKILNEQTPMTDKEKNDLYKNSLYLDNYICRLCGKCITEKFNPAEVFLLEGLFDRQMDRKRIADTADYALQERLKHWFGQSEKAQKEYACLKKKVNPEQDYSELNSFCPYNIDINAKLKICHEKLSCSGYVY